MKLNFDEVVDRTADKCRKWDAEIIQREFNLTGSNILPMWIADMDFKSPACITTEFEKIIARGTYGYTYVYDEFYQAVIDWQKRRHQASVKRESIILTYGTVSTIHYVIQAFSRPGDKIMVNTPVYSPFATATTANRREVITNPLLKKENRYQLDFKKIEEQLQREQPKIYFFCSPHNPSGRIWNESELTKLAELCLRYQVLLVVDEVHGEHIHQGDFFSSLCLAPKLQKNLIVLTSPNKAFNLGGLKTSYGIIRNQQLLKIFKQQLKKNSITSPNIFGISGLVSAYNDGEKWLDEVSQYIFRNYTYMCKRLNKELPDVKIMPLESSYLPWLDFSAYGYNSDELVALIASETGVLLESGHHFVAEGEGYIRLNIGTTRANLHEALDKIIACLN